MCARVYEAIDDIINPWLEKGSLGTSHVCSMTCIRMVYLNPLTRPCVDFASINLTASLMSPCTAGHPSRHARAMFSTLHRRGWRVRELPIIIIFVSYCQVDTVVDLP